MNTGQLARDLVMVMNGGGINGMQIQHAINNVHSVMRASGVSQTGIQSVTSALMMVARGGNLNNGMAQLN